MDPELFQAIGATHLLLGEAVVIANSIAHHGTDMAEAIKLRADLADLTAEHLIVVHQFL